MSEKEQVMLTRRAFLGVCAGVFMHPAEINSYSRNRPIQSVEQQTILSPVIELVENMTPSERIGGIIGSLVLGTLGMIPAAEVADDSVVAASTIVAVTAAEGFFVGVAAVRALGEILRKEDL